MPFVVDASVTMSWCFIRVRLVGRSPVHNGFHLRAVWNSIADSGGECACPYLRMCCVGSCPVRCK